MNNKYISKALMLAAALVFTTSGYAGPGPGPGGGGAGRAGGQRMGGGFDPQQERPMMRQHQENQLRGRNQNQPPGGQSGNQLQQREEQQIRERIHQDPGNDQQIRERNENQIRERVEQPGMQQRQQQMENIRQQTEDKARGDVPGATKRWWWPFGE